MAKSREDEKKGLRWGEELMRGEAERMWEQNIGGLAGKSADCRWEGSERGTCPWCVGVGGHGEGKGRTSSGTGECFLVLRKCQIVGEFESHKRKNILARDLFICILKCILTSAYFN